MAILGKHIDLVIELIQQFLADVGIEDLLNGHIDIEILTLMDRTKSTHGYLLSNFQITHTDDQYPIN